MNQKQKEKLVSIIIPTFNEEKVIGDCLDSLASQAYKPMEIIVVDDGSTDKTLSLLRHLFESEHRNAVPQSRRPDTERSKVEGSKLKVLHQNHLGPGTARNLGASKAKGQILVFADADMTFDKNFIKDLVTPILKGKTIGTFSKNEMNANKNNIWSVCWNINRNWPIDRLVPLDYPDQAPVFRAIAKYEFDKVGGFNTTGEYTDDWSLSRKLGVKSTVAPGAIYYHSNPQTLPEVWRQARWIGKNEFISGNFVRRLRSLIWYSLPISLVTAIAKSFLNFNFYFLIFKLIYDLAIWTSVIKSFFKEPKSK